jgi:hypothetical protein
MFWDFLNLLNSHPTKRDTSDEFEYFMIVTYEQAISCRDVGFFGGIDLEEFYGDGS